MLIVGINVCYVPEADIKASAISQTKSGPALNQRCVPMAE
jgi:hypothetical protein